jgi:hypothetical protein
MIARDLKKRREGFALVGAVSRTRSELFLFCLNSKMQGTMCESFVGRLSTKLRRALWRARSFSLSSSAMLVLPAYAILAVGPALALYGVFIGRRRPFLFLVTLAR